MAHWLKYDEQLCAICIDEDRVFSERLFTKPNEPDGWGYTSCCHRQAHYHCLGRWLNPHEGREIDSTSGVVELNRACPFCKKHLSRSSRRMMTTVVRDEDSGLPRNMSE